MTDNEYMYVILIKSLTGLGKFSRKISKYEYTHIAVSFTDKLDDFVTFSRKKHYSPFHAGFMHEKREHYAFGNNEEVKVKVFRLQITKEALSKIKKYIKQIESDQEYIFNLYSMLTMPFLHGFEIYKSHNCMSFVSEIIKLSNTVQMKKEYYKYNIKEIDKMLEKYFYKEFYLKRNKIDNDYMRKESFLFNLKSFVKLNATLIYRIIFKNKTLRRKYESSNF